MSDTTTAAEQQKAEIRRLHAEASDLRRVLRGTESNYAGLLAVLAELRAEHTAVHVCDWCGYPEADHEGGPWPCAGYSRAIPARVIAVCGSCCLGAEGQHDCGHDHGEGLAICPTTAILDAAGGAS